MFKVKDSEEANRLARDMCKRHPELLGQVGPTASARDIALKIFLTELQVKQQGGVMEASSLQASPQASVIHQDATATTPQQDMSSGSIGASPIVSSQQPQSSASDEPTATTSVIPTAPPIITSSTPMETDQTTTPAPKTQEAPPPPPIADEKSTCPYCNEGSSRYCKMTGRRHENAEERHLRYWRKIYRQLAMASHFVNTARLAKKNSCVENEGVELNLD